MDTPVSMAEGNVHRLAVEDVLAAIGAAKASSGAGVAAALALALGIACARKAIGITLNRGRVPDLEVAEETLHLQLQRAVAHAQRDSLLFEAYMGARRPLEAQHLVESTQHFQQLVADFGKSLDDLRGRVADVVAGDIDAACALHRAASEISASLLREAREERKRLVP